MNTFLPYVGGNFAVSGQGDPCGMVERASKFAAWWLYRLGARRDMMTCDTRLTACAQAHAEYLAQRVDTSPSMHIGRGGSTANQRVWAAGYRLPLWHGDTNTVESVTRNWSDSIPDIVDSLMRHDTHHDHLWCLNFWEPNTNYGVGNAAEYFVIVTCPPEEL